MIAPSEWTSSDLDALVALCDAALPRESLTADELEASCFDDGIVLGTADRDAAISLCVRDLGDHTSAFVKLLAVQPASQRRGLGHRLLDDALTWAGDHGARDLTVGASAPFYLWPGIDVAMTGMLVTVESHGFEPRGDAINMAAPTSFRVGASAGVETRRALSEDDEHALRELVRANWPRWEAELARALEQGGCFGAWEGSAARGFACHSVNRAGWVGPIGTDPGHQHRGIAAALMSEVCRDLAAAGHSSAEIAWVGPIGFYAKAMGATVSRTFRVYARRL
jgi:GNAT superfamily N-acetyltransferase